MTGILFLACACALVGSIAAIVLGAGPLAALAVYSAVGTGTALFVAWRRVRCLDRQEQAAQSGA